MVRTSGGKVSEGKMNVVELGPKLEKKKVSPYSTSSSAARLRFCISSNQIPRMPKRTVMKKNPWSWMLRRPRESMKHTET